MNPVPPPIPPVAPQAPKLLERLRTALLFRGTKPEGAEDQVGWVRAFLCFHQLRHPDTLGEAEIGAFLTHLAVKRCVPLAQKARHALQFLSREFLHRELGAIPVSYVPRARATGQPLPKPLLEQMRDVLRVRHYAPATEDAYLNWVRRFILFHDTRHHLEMREEEIEGFLAYRAVECKIAASTQDQAFHALLFLYQHLLQVELDRLDAVRARRSEYLPTVLSFDEIRQVLDQITGGWGLYPVMTRLLYGAGLRVTECCRQRVQEVDLTRNQVFIRGGKWHKDCVLMLP